MTVIIDSTAVINAVRLAEQAGDPAAPAAGFWLLYAKALGLFIEDSSAVVTGPMGAGGGGGGATVALTLTNGTGSGAVIGDVVVIADYAASTFDLQTTLLVEPGDPNYLLGVVLDATIANGATGQVAVSGYVPQINLNSSVSAFAFAWVRAAYSTQEGEPFTLPGNYAGGPPNGAFGMTLDGGTTPPALIWNPPAPYFERKVRTYAGVDLNSATPTVLFTVPAGVSFVLTRVVVRNVSTSLTLVSFSLGYNAASYNDVVANATHTELTGSTLYTVLIAKNGAKLGAATTQLQLLCNTLQGGAATADLDIYGVFI